MQTHTSDTLGAAITAECHTAARASAERLQPPDVLYSVHDVDIARRTPGDAILWCGHREPSAEEISTATGHMGGIVRRMTRDETHWDFGAGWIADPHEAIAAALP